MKSVLFWPWTMPANAQYSPLGEAERRDRVDALGVCDVDRPSIRRRRQVHPSSSSANRG
jgi:hypothetical protein